MAGWQDEGAEGGPMSEGQLGRVYQDGEVIIQQGELGNNMFVIQEGQVEVFQEREGRSVQLAVLKEGDFFGEMALFDKEVRSATVLASGEVRVLTIDKKTFLRRIHEDPSLAFRIVETLSTRLRELNERYSLTPPIA
jgi:CRP/FNR family transcriptional regulator